MTRTIAFGDAGDRAALILEIDYYHDRAPDFAGNVAELGRPHYNPELGYWLFNIETAGYSVSVGVTGASDAADVLTTIDALVASLITAGYVARRTLDLDFTP